MERYDNWKIMERLVEVCRNPHSYTSDPNEETYRTKHLHLSLALSAYLDERERYFNEKFAKAVQQFKYNRKDKKYGYGWFHHVDDLLYLKREIDQLTWIVWGHEPVTEVKWRPELKRKAYKDLINQIDPTALMTPMQKHIHLARCNEIAAEVMAEILKEENSI